MAETITVTFDRQRFAKPADDDGLCWGIWVCQETTITGKLDPDICVRGMQFEVVGKWENHPRYGRQFKFHAYSRRQPNGRWGTIAFLMQAPNIGTVTAENIYNVFGEQSIEKVINEPEEVITRAGVRMEIIQQAAETLAPMLGEAAGKLPLLTLFKDTKIAANTAKRIMEAKWSDAVERLKKNPFLLMTHFSGIAFKQCDSLRLKLKLPKDMPERILAACKQAFADQSDQTWIKPKDIKKTMASLLELDSVNVEKAIKDLIDANEVTMQPPYIKGEEFYALTERAKIELEVARQLYARMNMPADRWPIEQIRNDPDLTDHQKEVIIHNMETGGRLIVLPGSPGTGKTFALSKIIQYFDGHAYCCAPTGKAAQRLSEGLVEKGLRPATTIHKMLEPLPMGDGSFGFQLQGNGNWVDADIVAVDETSMVNNWLASAAFRGIHPGTYIILVGDKNQLPPVGPGTMLRDMQELGFREFTQIQRNAGSIVKTCHAIKDQEDFKLHRPKEPGCNVELDTNIHLAFASKDEKKLKRVEEIVDLVLAGKVDGVNDPMQDIQFLTATHRNAHVGREALNKLLQKKLNPNGKGKHAVYKVGDKIICLENTNIAGTEKFDGTKEFVANGELGTVVESHEKRIIVRMNSNPKRDLVVPCGPKAGNGWDLGYCITVHKSQGSEWNVTVTVIGSDFGSKLVTCREWIYTAFSRSQVCSIAVATQAQIYDMCKVNRIWDRKSYILDHLKQLEELNAIVAGETETVYFADGTAAEVPVEDSGSEERAKALDF